MKNDILTNEEIRRDRVFIAQSLGEPDRVFEDPKTAPYTRVYRFRGLVALCAPGAPTVYMGAESARRLGHELRKAAKDARENPSLVDSTYGTHAVQLDLF